MTAKHNPSSLINSFQIKGLFKVSKGKKCEEESHSQLRYIQIEDLRHNNNLKYAAIDTKNVLCRKEDIIIAWDGANAGTIGYGLEGAIGSTLAKLSPITNTVFSPYAGRFLQSKFNFLRDNCTGATIPHISTPSLLGIKIPLPPLAEQQNIASILDAADSLRQKDQQLIKKYTALSHSLFLEMFGDPETNPMGWEQLILEDMVQFLTSGSRGWAQYYSDEGDLFLRIQNVGNNQLLLDNLTYVNPPNNAEAKRTTVKAGDILLSITADLGRTAVIPANLPKAHINQHLAIIRLKDIYEPYYVSEYISSVGGKRQLMKLDKSGVKAGLNFTDIKSLNILNPPIDLQRQYLERSRKVEAQKQIAQASLQKSENLFNSLLQRAFKGELTA